MKMSVVKDFADLMKSYSVMSWKEHAVRNQLQDGVDYDDYDAILVHENKLEEFIDNIGDSQYCELDGVHFDSELRTSLKEFVKQYASKTEFGIFEWGRERDGYSNLVEMISNKKIPTEIVPNFILSGINFLDMSFDNHYIDGDEDYDRIMTYIAELVKDEVSKYEVI